MSYKGEREIPTRRLSEIHFSTFTTEEVKALSVKEITNPTTFDVLQNPALHGLYDPALGPVSHHDVCATCQQLAIHCPGHVGHISLPLPVYHPFFYSILHQLLRVMCLCCDRLILPDEPCRITKAQLDLLDRGLLVPALNLLTDLQCEEGKSTLTASTNTSGYSRKLPDPYDRGKTCLKLEFTS
eukprot:m.268010 g.268010  ORF g.268010 m.268010 type:complete len:184 (+) comp40524_c1_seq16:41-592(+)